MIKQYHQSLISSRFFRISNFLFPNFYRKFMLLSVVLSVSGSVAAENLIFNSGFELGDAGYECMKVLQPDTNPSMKYVGLVTDSATFVSGRQSLRIPNSFAERVELVVREFKLKPDTEYTFSLFMKSNVAESKVLAIIDSSFIETGGVRHNRRHFDTSQKIFHVGSEWRKYNFTFKTKAVWSNPYYSLFILFGNVKGLSGVASDLWLDNLMLQKGGPSLYQPGADIEAAVMPSRKYYIYGYAADAKPEFELRLLNNSNQTISGKVVLTATEQLHAGTFEALDDEHPGKAVTTETLEVTLRPHEAKSFPRKFPFRRYGGFILTPSISGCPGKSFAALNGPFAIAGKYECKPIDIYKSFSVGFNLGGAGFNDGWGSFLAPGYYACGMGQDEFLKLLRAMGCRLIRDWNNAFEMLSWRMLEPEEGRFDFRLSDMALDAFTRHRMTVVPVLGLNDFLCKGRGRWPDWLMSKCVKKENSGEWKRTVYLPPIELWRKYIRALAGHYKGRIRYYEIMNEPNGWLDARDYIRYLKVAYKELKAVDPECHVIGFCATGDIGGNVMGFMEQCFKSGGLKFADIVSFHPYDAPTLNSVSAADKQIMDVKRLIAKYGQGRTYPLWNTELYALRGIRLGNFIDSKRHGAYEIVWRFLTDLGEGIAQSPHLLYFMCFRNRLTPHYPNYAHRSLQFPNADFVAYNALSRFFEGAKPMDKIRWSNSAICYIYQKKDHQLAAFWNYGDMKNLKLKFVAKPAGIRWFDLFGNEFSLPADGIINLGSAPCYLTAKPGLDLVSIMKGATVESEHLLKTGTMARLVPRNNGWNLIVPLRNCTGRTLVGKMGVQAKNLVSAKSVGFTVPANQETDVAVPVRLKSQESGRAHVKIALNSRILDLPLKVSAPGKVLRTGDREQIGPALMRFSCNNKIMKLIFEVKDATPSGKKSAGRMPWEQDCIELFFDADPGLLRVKHPESYHGKVGRLFILPYAPETQRLVKRSGELDFSGVSTEILVRNGGYTVEVKVPLSAFGITDISKGRFIGFDVQLDDANTVGRQSAVSWNSQGKAHKDRCSFGFIEL